MLPATQDRCTRTRAELPRCPQCACPTASNGHSAAFLPPAARVALSALTLGLALLACQRQATLDEDACQALQEGHQSLLEQSQALQLEAKQLPLDMQQVREIQRSLAELLNRVQELFVALEDLHFEHEPKCKRAALVNDDFDTAFERVYQPYISISANLIQTVESASQRLEESDDAYLHPAAEALLDASARMTQKLAEQVAVCQTDFDKQRCLAFDDAVRQHQTANTNDVPALDEGPDADQEPAEPETPEPPEESQP